MKIFSKINVGNVVFAGILLILLVSVIVSIADRRRLYDENSVLKGTIEIQDKEKAQADLAYEKLRKSAEDRISELNGALDSSATVIARLEGENEILAVENEKIKSGIKDAPDTYIVKELARRIGEENVRFTVAGTYELTREGANRTLFRFVDGETAMAESEKKTEIIGELKKEVFLISKKYDEEHKLRIASEDLVAKFRKVDLDKDVLIRNLEKRLGKRTSRQTLERGAALAIIAYLAFKALAK